MGDILNQSPAQMRDDLLAALDEDDTQFAGSVRKAIFTFAQIPTRIAPRDIPALVRAVDGDALRRALAAASALEGPEAQVPDFMLENMPQRLADGLRDDMADLGDIAGPDGERAMITLVAAIRKMADAGDLTLQPPQQEE